MVRASVLPRAGPRRTHTQLDSGMQGLVEVTRQKLEPFFFFLLAGCFVPAFSCEVMVTCTGLSEAGGRCTGRECILMTPAPGLGREDALAHFPKASAGVMRQHMLETREAAPHCTAWPERIPSVSRSPAWCVVREEVARILAGKDGSQPRLDGTAWRRLAERLSTYAYQGAAKKEKLLI